MTTGNEFSHITLWIFRCVPPEVSHQWIQWVKNAQLKGTVRVQTCPGTGDYKGHFIEMKWRQFYLEGSLDLPTFWRRCWNWCCKTKLGSLQMFIRGGWCCLIGRKTERRRAVTWTKWGICLAGSLDNEAFIFQLRGVTDSPTPGYKIWVTAFNASH